MAVYKNVENIRKLFDNEYKSTRKLINEGETHLDNLAEGFSEATRVLDMLPTEDVVPRSEVEKLQSQVNRLKAYDEERDIQLHQRLVREAKQEVAKQIFEEIEKLTDMYSVPKEYRNLDFVVNSCENSLKNSYAELKKKYIGD